MGFLTFDGTPGNYLSTDDVNLLDADTAHIVQSNPWNSSWLTVVDDGPQADGFGQLTGTVQVTGTAARLTRGGLTIPITPGAHTMLCTLTNRTLANLNVKLRLWDDIGGVADTVSVPPGESVISVSLNPTGTTLQTLWVEIPAADAVAGDKFSLSKMMVASGAVSTFVPSLRIVGDVDMQFTASVPTSWINPNLPRLIDAFGVGGSGYLLYMDGAANMYTLVVQEVDGTQSVNAAITAGADVSTLLGGTYVATTGRGAVLQNTVEIGAAVWVPRAIVPAASGVLAVGGHSNGVANPFIGNISLAEVRDDIGGPIVAQADLTNLTTAEVAAGQFNDRVTGRLWTINGAAWEYVWDARLLMLGVG